jgi:uncharacterized protein (DUF488 family)
MAIVYTIGHSTRTFDELVAPLQAHGIQRLVDIRSFPMSRRMPWFNRESLEQELPKDRIEYLWLKDLGGRRGKQMEHSPNTGLRNASFRNYADYMLTPAFRAGIDELLRLAVTTPTAIMCAERVWFHCHRMLVSDWLVAHGHEVVHIDDTARPLRPHKLTPEAALVGDQLQYPGLLPG